MSNPIRKKILIAPNSFKECAGSVETATLILRAFEQKIRPEVLSEIDFTLIPISDGGDGLLEVCRRKFDLEILTYKITTPYDESEFECMIGYSRALKTIYIESAYVLGLKLIPPGFRNPFMLTSRGMGELLTAVNNDVKTGKLDAEKIIVGIGGTGTNDLGIGLMSVFGMELFDSKGEKLSALPENFKRVEKIHWEKPEMRFSAEIIIDVNNPLLGENGASRVFGPQKGFSQAEAEGMDKEFGRILKLLGIEESKRSVLSGAGGGLAAAFQIFFDAGTKYSKEFIKHELGIDSATNKFDAVITGEGKVDSQSLLDKGATVVSSEYAGEGIPVYFICGINDSAVTENDNLKFIELQKYFTSAKESMDNFEIGINKACEEIINDLKFGV